MARRTATKERKGRPRAARDVIKPRGSSNALPLRDEYCLELLDSASEAIIVGDSENRILLVNRKAEEMFGYKRQELLGQLIQILVPQRLRDIHAEHVKRYLASPRIRPMGPELDIAGRRKDGTEFPLECGLGYVKTEDGVLVIAVMTDITGRRDAQAALRESEERFRTLSGAAFEGIVVHEGGKILDVNEAYARIFGYELSEVIGAQVLDHVAPESRDLVSRNVQSDYASPYEAVGVRKDGSTFPVEACGKTVSYRGRKVRVAATRDITERKQAEEALSAERDRAQKYLDVAEVIFVAINAKGQVTLINPKGCAVLGYEEKDVLGKNWFDLVLPAALRREVRAVFRKLMAGEIEPVEYYENPVRTRCGEERLIAWHNTVLRDDAGDIVGTLSSGEDVTERRRAEEALRATEERLHTVVAGAPIVMFAADREGVITLAEGKGLEALGLKPDQVIGQSIFDIYRDTPQVRENFHRALAGDTFMSMAEVGGVMFEAWEAPLRDQNGEITGITGVVTDITERKRAEEALREQVRQNEQVLQTTMDGFILADTNGRLLDVNPAYCDMAGYSREELLRMNIRQLEVQLGPEEIERRIEQMVEQGKDRFETKHKCKDGSIIDLDVSIVIMQPDENPLVAAFVRDITERRRAEEVLREREGELRQLTARLLDVQEDERRAVARELHDEIGQLLTGLSLTLETCVRSPRQATTDRLRETQGSVDELISRVSDLSLDLRPAMLDDLGLLPALLWHLERYASRTGVRVDFKHNGLEGRFAPEVETAAYRIIQEALTNVARHAGVSETTVRLWADQDTLLVRIEDQGTGFDPAAVLAAGHASGLAGMQERAALCGGQLTVDSEPGGGTRLALELPAGGMTPRGKR